MRRPSVAGGAPFLRAASSPKLSAEVSALGGAVGLGASGELRGVVLVELADVAGEVDERPFAAGGVDAAAAEAPDLAVVLAVAEDGFDQAGALLVGGGALGGA